MKHCVFCAGIDVPENQDHIKLAIKAAYELDEQFGYDNDIAESGYRSQITILDETNNISVWFENTSETQLVNDCMLWYLYCPPVDLWSALKVKIPDEILELRTNSGIPYGIYSNLDELNEILNSHEGLIGYRNGLKL